MVTELTSSSTTAINTDFKAGANVDPFLTFFSKNFSVSNSGRTRKRFRTAASYSLFIYMGNKKNSGVGGEMARGGGGPDDKQPEERDPEGSGRLCPYGQGQVGSGVAGAGHPLRLKHPLDSTDHRGPR